MSASSIKILLDVMGIQNAKDAAATLYTLKQAIQGVQQLSSYGQGILPPMIGPNQGMARGVADYQEQNRALTDQAKQIRDMSVSYREHEQAVFNAGRSYGYMRDQMIQVADAYKQIQGEQNRLGMQTGTLGYARLTGLDPTFLAGQGQQLAQQGVASNTGQQNQFFAMMEEAVMRGSRGGYTVLASDLMPLITNLNAQALNRNPYGYGMGGVQATSDFLSNAYASGIPGLRGQGGANLYNQANQTLTSAEDGMGGMLAWNAYQQAHPGSNYFDFEYGRQQGMQDPAYAKALIGQVRSVYGSNDKQRFVLGGQALGMTPQNYEALERVMSMSTNPTDYAAELKRIGARGDIDPGAVGLIGRLQGTQDQKGIDQTIADYEQLSGKKYGGKRDKESVERFFGQLGPNSLMGTFADQNSKAQADTAAAYSDAAANIRDYILQMNEFNAAVGTATSTLAHLDPQHFAAAGAAASIGGPIIGGVMGGVSTAISLGALMARFGGGAAANTPAAGGLLGRIGGGMANAWQTARMGPVLGPNVPGMQGPTLPGEPPIPQYPGQFPAGAAVGAGAIAAGAYVGYQALVEQPKRDAAAEAARSEKEKEDRYQAYERDKQSGGPLAAILHPKYLFMDDAQTKDIQAREARDKAGGKPGDVPKAGDAPGGTTSSVFDDMLATNKQQVDLLTKIEGYLAPTANTDRRAQATYGANAAPRTANAGGPVAPYNGVASGGGGGYTAGGGYAPGGGYSSSGTPGEGFGNPSVEQVDAMLKGTKLEGYGAQIIADAKAAGVPVSVALGMIRQESSFTTPAQGTKNNFGGLKGPGGTGAFADFPDIASGLSAVIGNMGTKTYQGKSLQDFVSTYLGGPAGGDPDAYLKNVMQIIQQLGGNAGPGNVVVGPPGGGGTAPGQAGSNAGNAALGLLSRVPGGAMAALGGGGTAASGGQVTMQGYVEVVVKQPDGSQDRHWVAMSPSTGQPFGGIVNWPTRGNNLG